MYLFESIVEEVIKEKNNALNEGMENGTFYVYHMCPKKAMEGITKTGFERFFGASQVAMSYGPGVYTTVWPSYDKRSKCHNPRLDVDLRRFYYSEGGMGESVVLKCIGKNGLKGFMIYDEEVAAKVYGKENAPFDKQIKLLMDPDEYNELVNNHKWQFDEICGVSHGRYFDNQHFWNGSGGAVAGSFDNVMSNYPKSYRKIRGLSFHGGHDGFVAIYRNFNDVIPVEVAYDYCKPRYQTISDLTLHFKPANIDPRFFEYVKNNNDIYSDLGVVDKFNPKTHRRTSSYNSLPQNAKYDVLPPYFIANFARVESLNRYNYIFRKTFKKGPISNVWFDSAPEAFRTFGTTVTLEGNRLLLKQNIKDDEIHVYVPAYEFNNEEDVYIGPLSKFSKDGLLRKMKERLDKYFENVFDFNKDFEGEEKPIDDEPNVENTEQQDDFQQQDVTNDDFGDVNVQKTEIKPKVAKPTKVMKFNDDDFKW